jgi:hypothetical protein
VLCLNSVDVWLQLNLGLSWTGYCWKLGLPYLRKVTISGVAPFTPLLLTVQHTISQSRPYLSAGSAGDIGKLQVLLALGADSNQGDHTGRTPLHWAVASGHTQVAGYLLDAGADETLADSNGCVASHYACQVLLSLLHQVGSCTELSLD